MTIDVYGIRNCNTMKKAFAWLEGQGIAYVFHDYKKEGASAERLAGWADRLGWEKLINRSGTTFRGLADADKADLDRARALALMQAKPSLIRRPLIEADGALIVGLDPEEFAAKLGGK